MKNKNNKKNNNNNNNYFAKNIREKGEDFIYYKNAKELSMDAKKIFREIARGQIDLIKYSKYFLEPQFLEICIQTAYTEYCRNNIIFNGVNLLISQTLNSNMMIDNFTVAVKEEHKRSSEAYCFIYQTLNMVKMTCDPSHLYILPNRLKDYKYNL